MVKWNEILPNYGKLVNMHESNVMDFSGDFGGGGSK